ncbi:MAG: UPF0175 family protein [Caldilineaceae bacterium]
MLAPLSSPPPVWALNQVIALFERRPDLVTAALNRVLAEDADLRWSLVVDLYLDQQINLSKAAELLDMHPLTLRERFLELGIPLRLGPADLAEAKAEVEAIRH